MTQLRELLWKAEAIQRFEEMRRDPAHAYERRRADMLLTMIRSVAYKEVGFDKDILPQEYLVEQGFTLVEIKEFMPSCLVLMAAFYIEHKEIFKAIKDARKTDG